MLDDDEVLTFSSDPDVLKGLLPDLKRGERLLICGKSAERHQEHHYRSSSGKPSANSCHLRPRIPARTPRQLTKPFSRRIYAVIIMHRTKTLRNTFLFSHPEPSHNRGKNGFLTRGH